MAGIISGNREKGPVDAHTSWVSRSLQGLRLALLIDTKHDGFIGRIEL